MTRPLSNDLRGRVVAAVAAGESCRSVAERFGVAVSSVVKWSQRYRATGSVRRPRWAGIANGFWSRIAPSSWSGSTRPRT
ncbi:helix-turn-helix domain-containing protein [Mesorhizobium sp. M9A.F.Ca.ET.002.03.1.2]|uniref:helix-turn-helix domain-containing protein n=1 Tax=Mesorhizobium sp. M9A.F.Ca.ET.002.03.1.2 TaxID=2493668 RepID=UPI001FDFE39A|nr:helix-turn-helix domain-containing protein [Mesorhizobium sp. M9A.F.Ca.ET.002.03.1.2]